MATIRRFVRSLFKQLSHIRLLLIFSSLILLFPLTIALPITSLQRFIGGLLTELTIRQIYLVMLFLSLLVIAVVICQALVVDSLPKRYDPSLPLSRERLILKRSQRGGPAIPANPHMPFFLDNALGFPIGIWQIVIFTLLWTPWLWITVRHANSTASLPALVSGLLGIGTAIGAFIAAALLTPSLARSPVIGRIMQLPTYTFAVSSFLLTFAIYIVLGFLFHSTVVPSIIYVLVLLTALAYIFGILEVLLPLWGVPSWIFLLAIVLLGGQARRLVQLPTYSLDVTALSTNYAVKAPNLRADLHDNNLVVVAVSGGGILSAVWSTYWLNALFQARPELECEIRLFSTVSGGSVGIAHFLTALKQEVEQSGDPNLSCDGTKARNAAARAFNAARQSSLSAVTFSLAYPDLWRLLNVGGGRFLDRGRNIEAAWKSHAIDNMELDSSDDLTFSNFAELIAEQKMPGFVFNTTALETGRRIMITPLAFSPIAYRDRAQTLSELWGGESSQIDLGIYTAARASATFPYISPAARSDLEASEQTKPAEYHLIDGGYNDNFGIQSALDFLRPIVNDAAKNLKDDTEADESIRILIIEMRLTNFENEALTPDALNPVTAEWLGPPYGILNVAQKAQIENNNIDLGAFVNAANNVGIPVEILTIQPDTTVPGPLSWHLSKQEIEGLFPPTSDAIGQVDYHADCKAFENTAGLSCAPALVFDSWDNVNCLSQMDNFLSSPSTQEDDSLQYAEECRSRRADLTVSKEERNNLMLSDGN